MSARAALGVPMTYLMVHQDFGLTGLDLTTEDLQRPEGKTLLATLPIMLLSKDHLTESIKPQAQPFFELFAETVRGDAEVNYRRYQDSSPSWMTAFASTSRAAGATWRRSARRPSPGTSSRPGTITCRASSNATAA